jgi:hypothetical protein
MRVHSTAFMLARGYSTVFLLARGNSTVFMLVRGVLTSSRGETAACRNPGTA